MNRSLASDDDLTYSGVLQNDAGTADRLIITGGTPLAVASRMVEAIRWSTAVLTGDIGIGQP